MSRHTIAHPTLHIVVGFDPPLQSFFCTVDDLSKSEEEQELLWEGCTPKALTTLDQLQAVLAAYAVLPEAVCAQLVQDQASAEPPTPLQQYMLRRVWEVRAMP
jgi:hypothetical protein